MKSYRAAASQGSHVLQVSEDLRSLLDTGQEVFLNRVTYATHRTRAPKQWERKTVELDRPFAEPSDKNIEFSFLPKLTPKAKLKPISLDPKPQKETELHLSVDSLAAADVNGAAAPANSSADAGKPSEASTLSPSSPTNKMGGSFSQPSPSNATRQSEQRTLSLASPSAASGTGSESVLEAQRRAQARVLRRLAEEKQALERKDAAEAEELRLRLEKNDIKVRTMAERTLERVNDYLTRKQQQEEEQHRQLEATAMHLAESNASVHSESYRNKIRELRADANKRMLRYQNVRLQSLLEEEKQQAEKLASVRQRKGADTTFKPKRRAGGVVYVHNVDENCDYIEEPGSQGRPRIQHVLNDIDALEAPHRAQPSKPAIHRQRSQSGKDRRPPPRTKEHTESSPRQTQHDGAREESLLEYIDRNEQPPTDLNRFLADHHEADGDGEEYRGGGGALSAREAMDRARPATIHSASVSSGSVAAADRETYLANAAPIARVAFRPAPPPQPLPEPQPSPARRVNDNPDALFDTSHNSPLERYLQGDAALPNRRGRRDSRRNNRSGGSGSGASDSSDLSDITIDRPQAPRASLPQAQAPRTQRPRRGAEGTKSTLPALGAASPLLPSLASDQSASLSTQKSKAKTTFKRLAPIPIAPYQPVPPR